MIYKRKRKPLPHTTDIPTPSQPRPVRLFANGGGLVGLQYHAIAPSLPDVEGLSMQLQAEDAKRKDLAAARAELMKQSSTEAFDKMAAEKEWNAGEVEDLKRQHGEIFGQWMQGYGGDPYKIFAPESRKELVKMASVFSSDRLSALNNSAKQNKEERDEILKKGVQNDRWLDDTGNYAMMKAVDQQGNQQIRPVSVSEWAKLQNLPEEERQGLSFGLMTEAEVNQYNRESAGFGQATRLRTGTSMGFSKVLDGLYDFFSGIGHTSADSGINYRTLSDQLRSSGVEMPQDAMGFQRMQQSFKQNRGQLEAAKEAFYRSLSAEGIRAIKQEMLAQHKDASDPVKIKGFIEGILTGEVAKRNITESELHVQDRVLNESEAKAGAKPSTNADFLHSVAQMGLTKQVTVQDPQTGQYVLQTVPNDGLGAFPTFKKIYEGPVNDEGQPGLVKNLRGALQLPLQPKVSMLPLTPEVAGRMTDAYVGSPVKNTEIFVDGRRISFNQNGNDGESLSTFQPIWMKGSEYVYETLEQVGVDEKDPAYRPPGAIYRDRKMLVLEGEIEALVSKMPGLNQAQREQMIDDFREERKPGIVTKIENTWNDEDNIAKLMAHGLSKEQATDVVSRARPNGWNSAWDQDFYIFNAEQAWSRQEILQEAKNQKSMQEELSLYRENAVQENAARQQLRNGSDSMNETLNSLMGGF